MQGETDKFAAFAELAVGEETHQYIPLVDVATHIGVDVHRVVKAALELKREMGGLQGQVMWLRGVPWFSFIIAAAIEAKLQAEVLTNIGGKVRVET